MGQSLTENNFATVIVKKMKFLPSGMFSLALVANERAEPSLIVKEKEILLFNQSPLTYYIKSHYDYQHCHCGQMIIKHARACHHYWLGQGQSDGCS